MDHSRKFPAFSNPSTLHNKGLERRSRNWNLSLTGHVCITSCWMDLVLRPAGSLCRKGADGSGWLLMVDGIGWLLANVGSS